MQTFICSPRSLNGADTIEKGKEDQEFKKIDINALSQQSSRPQVTESEKKEPISNFAKELIATNNEFNSSPKFGEG